MIRILHGDCREVLRTLPDAAFAACICDPPYHLTSIVKRFGGANAAPAKHGTDGAFARASRGFMGQTWDGGDIAQDPAMWAEVLRVLKPGAHLAAFGGTRTFHRMACAIEDAGFEIKDTLMFMYGTGFPKSHNVDNHLRGDQRCLCARNGVSYQNEKERSSDNEGMRELRDGMGAKVPVSGDAEQDMFSRVRVLADSESEDGQISAGESQSKRSGDVFGVRDAVLPQQEMAGARFEAGMLPPMQRSATRSGVGKARAQGGRRTDSSEQGVGNYQDDWAAQPSLEGRRDLPEASRQLCERPLCEMPAGVSEHGPQGWVCDGASASDGAMDRPAAPSNRVCSSRGSQAAEQRAGKPDSLAVQPQPQNGGAWPLCGGCGKPIIPNGLGTALKPAYEPIILARKPLAGTVAANVLAHGCGALNIDASRIPGTESTRRVVGGNSFGLVNDDGWIPNSTVIGGSDAGRWPANLVHDGSPEVEAAFAAFGERTSGGINGHRQGGSNNAMSGCNYERTYTDGRTADTGTASRFFFTAKADASDRAGSKHPTVKPTALMRWLVRLVTPPGGAVLDPFAGSGSTGLAADQLGFDATLIEQDAEYVADIRRKITGDAPLFAEVI